MPIRLPVGPVKPPVTLYQARPDLVEDPFLNGGVLEVYFDLHLVYALYGAEVVLPEGGNLRVPVVRADPDKPPTSLAAAGPSAGSDRSIVTLCWSCSPAASRFWFIADPFSKAPSGPGQY